MISLILLKNYKLYKASFFVTLQTILYSSIKSSDDINDNITKNILFISFYLGCMKEIMCPTYYQLLHQLAIYLEKTSHHT